MANRKQTITLWNGPAVAVLAAVASAAWIAVLLFVLAAFLIAWGLEPKRTEVFVGRLPYGNYLLKALTKLDLMLSDRNWRDLTAASLNYTDPSPPIQSGRASRFSPFAVVHVRLRTDIVIPYGLSNHRRRQHISSQLWTLVVR